MDTNDSAGAMVWVDIRPRNPANFLWIFVIGEPEPALIEQMAAITFEQDCLDWAIVPLQVSRETP